MALEPLVRGGQVPLDDRLAARDVAVAAGKGVVAPGADADLVVVDPAGTTTIRGAEQAGAATWSPFEGRSLRHAIVSVWLRGAPVDPSMPRGRHLARRARAAGARR